MIPNAEKIAIIGLGLEGLATIKYLSNLYPNKEIHAFDEGANQLKPASFNIPYHTGEKCLDKLLDFDVILVSPGISVYRKELITAQKNGSIIIPTTQLWYDRHKDDFCIFVTGTKGKSTTSSLIYHVLNSMKENVHLIGNIGKPAVDSIVDSTNNTWIVETSSYQSAKLNVKPDISVLTNLYPEHIDWHGSIEQYYKDKLRLLNKSKLQVINLNIKDKVFNKNKTIYFNDKLNFHYKNNTIYKGEIKIGKIKSTLLKGSHNLENICAMLCVVDLIGVDPKHAINLLDGFQKMEHRLEEFAKIDNILYVDDCLSTIPQSTISAIESYYGYKITLIIGGADRGLGKEWKKFAKHLSKANIFSIIGMPDTGFKVVQELESMQHNSKLFYAKNLKDAVLTAKKVAPTGGVILLSPASPSHNKYKNYREKGMLFQSLSLNTRHSY